MSGSREKLRAIFLTAVMITSVFALGFAATGSTAAQSSATTVTAQDISLNSQAPTDVSGSSLSPSEQTADAGSTGTVGSTINSQGNDSLQTGAPSGVTPNTGYSTSGESTADPSDDYFGALSLDVDQDGNAEEVDYQLADSSSDGTFDQLFIDQDNDDSLNDQSAIGGTSGGTSNAAFTLSGVTFDLTIVGSPTADDTTDDVTISAQGQTGSLNIDETDSGSTETVEFGAADTDSDAVIEALDLDLDTDDDFDTPAEQGVQDSTVTVNGNYDFSVAIKNSGVLSTGDDIGVTADTAAVAVREGAKAYNPESGLIEVNQADSDSDGVADQLYLNLNQNDDAFESSETVNPTTEVTADSLNEKVKVTQSAGTVTIKPVLRAGVTYDIRALEVSDAANTAILDDVGADILGPVDGDTSATYDGGTNDDFSSSSFNSNGNVTFLGVTPEYAGTDVSSGGTLTGEGYGSVSDETDGDAYIGIGDTDDTAGSPSPSEAVLLEVEPSSQLYDVSSTLSSIEYNEEKTFTVSVTDQDGNAVSSADVEIILDNDGDGDLTTGSQTTAASGFTDSNGEASFNIQPSRAGTLVVKVTDDVGGTVGDRTSTDGISDVEDTTTQTTVDPIALTIKPSVSELQDGFSASPTFDLETPDGSSFTDGATVEVRGAPLPESGPSTNTFGDETNFNTFGDDNSGGSGVKDGTVDSNDGTYNAPFSPDETGTIDVKATFDAAAGGVAEYNGTTTLNVGVGNNLNVQTDTQNNALNSGPFSPVLTVTDSNAEGLKNTADGNLESNDFEEVSITVTSTNGEFSIDSATGDLAGGLDAAPDGDSNEPAFNNTGNDLTISGVTVENGDLDTDASTFEIEGLSAEQNTTLTFDVSVTTSAGDSYTSTVTTNITNSDTVSDLSLPSEVQTGTTADLSLSVTDGVSSVNNRVVVLEKQGGVTDGDDLFNVSETSNADVNAIVFNPVEGQVEFDTDGNLNNAPEAKRSLSVNNGEYVVEDVTIASAGVDHRLSVREYNTNPTAGALRAQLDNVVTSAGVSAYTITSDVDPVLAGQDEQINLTVTENGNAVNGTELVELAGNTNIDQQGSAVDDVSGPSAVDTDGDSTEDVIQATINADESGTDAVNVSTNLNDNSKTGSVSLDVVQPAISTNLTGNLTLGLTSSNVEITAEDPRDGTALQDTDLRLTATNVTYDIDASDGSNIIADADDDTFDQSSISIADGNNGYVNLDENGTAVLDVSTQENNAGDQPLTLDLAVQNDSASYFGDSPVGVGELSLVNAPLDPGTDVSQTYQLVDANGDTVDLGTLQISGTGLDGSSQTKVTDEGFVNFDYTTSDSGTIEFKIIDSSDLAVNSDNNDGDGSAEFTVKTINVLEQVNLSLSADQTDVTPGDSVEFNLTREDFDRQTTGTLTIRNASGDTVDTVSIDQTATVTFDEAGEFAVEASKPTRPSVGKSFTNASATISVQVGEGTDEELARFDAGDDGIIDRDEAVDAIVAYNTGGTVGGEEVTRDQAVQVIIAYNTGQTVAA